MNLLKDFGEVRCFVFDVDGVLTDSSILLLENGLQARRMNIKDGLALQMAFKAGYEVIIISGANSEPVRDRFNYLGIEKVFLGVGNKFELMDSIREDLRLEWKAVLFMGDDLPDTTLLKSVGLPCCPADAASEVQEICRYISPKKGGEGCVRDVIEKVLKINGHWDSGTTLRSR